MAHNSQTERLILVVLVCFVSLDKNIDKLGFSLTLNTFPTFCEQGLDLKHKEPQ